MTEAASIDAASAISDEDMELPADVFVARRPGSRRSTLGYHRFSTAAEAITFAVETYPSLRSDAVVMVVGNKRFELAALRTLHRGMVASTAAPQAGGGEASG